MAKGVFLLLYILIFMLQRCLERLKNGRQKFVNRFRQMDDSSLVKEVMDEEWIRLSEENKELPPWRPTRESCTPFAGVSKDYSPDVFY